MLGGAAVDLGDDCLAHFIAAEIPAALNAGIELPLRHIKPNFALAQAAVDFATSGIGDLLTVQKCTLHVASAVVRDPQAEQAGQVVEVDPMFVTGFPLGATDRDEGLDVHSHSPHVSTTEIMYTHNCDMYTPIYCGIHV